ncbi:energy transducer TonB [Shewanella youngdeokensis]|uniref:Protein TonB n=1 Tax=Shewanella youngdeokensis TaxID=2999068 RepID=A0ABZ0JXA2_9GAMM|nr:energy transducer TonB [Shewanella sp. DAU334]
MRRLLLLTPSALIFTVVIFGFIAWLVEPGKGPMPDPDSVLRFDVIQIEPDAQLQRRQRKLPEPPEKQLMAPTPQSQASAQQSESIAADMPDVPEINIDLAVAGLSLNIPITSQQTDLSSSLASPSIGDNQQVMPLHRVEPRYPARALKRKLEGYVLLGFVIDKKGNPQDIKVLDANPSQLFDREAIRALKRWKYQPKIVNGNATAQLGQSVRLEFKLQK